ncbi:biopolymer transporter ExbD [Treponema sp.]|uniref:ExbD/TolR family protein n=1 Tax=Treponema sp. TaxID=166 RepID=UPI00298E89AC|nr:biopolymer transporter ExbD [Treponema sp.]MCQ2242279.1 biopolymer transporter ExbD [Treponema sp.]
MIKRFVRHKVDDAGSSGSLNDLSFLLIIFFIVIAGFNVNKGFLLNLPSKDKPIVVNTQDILKCSLSRDGKLFLDGSEIELGDLSKKVSEKLVTWPNMTFLLTIDPDASYQNVVDVISVIRKLKVENFSFRMNRE